MSVNGDPGFELDLKTVLAAVESWEELYQEIASVQDDLGPWMRAHAEAQVGDAAAALVPSIPHLAISLSPRAVAEVLAVLQAIREALTGCLERPLSPSWALSAEDRQAELEARLSSLETLIAGVGAFLREIGREGPLDLDDDVEG